LGVLVVPEPHHALERLILHEEVRTDILGGLRSISHRGAEIGKSGSDNMKAAPGGARVEAPKGELNHELRWNRIDAALRRHPSG
jgi:hypothetical protein